MSRSFPLFLYWRLPLLVATIAVVLSEAHSTRWGLTLALPLVSGMAAVFLFSAPVVDRWIARGYLLTTDALLICLAVLGTGRPQPWLLAAFFLVIVVAMVTGDRLKTLLSTAALLSGMAGASSYISGFDFAARAFVVVPLLVAVALWFGTLAQQMGRRRERPAEDAAAETAPLWTLLKIGDTIGSTLEVGQVMRAIVRHVGDLVEATNCSILLSDESQNSCYVVAAKGQPEVDMLQVALDKYPEIRQALDTREPVVISDVDTNPLVAPVRDILMEKGYRSILVVPLLFGKEVLGTLFLRARREDSFSAEEIRFCQVAATISANALKNALLYRDVAQAAENHRSSSEKLRRILDGTPDMIVATDHDGWVTQFNRGAEMLTGIGEEQARARSLADILGRAGDELPDCETEPRDVALHRTDGEKVEISLVSAPLSSKEGSTVGRVWIGRDVTKLRRVEKSLVQAERLSSLGEVVAGVAHELNNPLSGVVGYAELLRGSSDDPNQARDLERIVDSAMRCQKIVFKLLSFARKHPTEKKYQNLNDCVSKVLDLKSYHLRSSQVETVLELDPDLPETCFDFHQVEQVILNLINNAEHAVATLKRPGRIVLHTGHDDGRVFCRIEDNGPGVPAAARERIFDPFFTTKGVGQGTGLGLSVSYGIVQEHGGNIELREADSEGGACFTVWLPIVDGERPGLESLSLEYDRQENPLAGRRVLVADDEPIVAELLARLLDDVGATTTLARDGQEAWDLLKDDDGYDLIVTDLRMPNMSGRDLYDRVAEAYPEMLRRFVFSTGDLAREETVSFLRGLPNRILTKPLELETVRRVLAQAVDARVG